MAEKMTEKMKENSQKFDPLKVTDRDTGKEYYGGDQNWYKSNTMAFAGCGSVAALNMLRTLAVKYPVEFKGKNENVRMKIMGLEGSASNHYWNGVKYFIPKEIGFESRTKQKTSNRPLQCNAKLWICNPCKRNRKKYTCKWT